MSLPYLTCSTCGGYEISGTLRTMALTLKSRCRCNDDDNDRRMESEARARAAVPLEQLTEVQGDALKRRDDRAAA